MGHGPLSGTQTQQEVTRSLWLPLVSGEEN